MIRSTSHERISECRRWRYIVERISWSGILLLVGTTPQVAPLWVVDFGSRRVYEIFEIGMGFIDRICFWTILLMPSHFWTANGQCRRVHGNYKQDKGRREIVFKNHRVCNHQKHDYRFSTLVNECTKEGRWSCRLLWATSLCSFSLLCYSCLRTLIFLFLCKPLNLLIKETMHDFFVNQIIPNDKF